jgi:hypothetical protein
MSHIIPVLDKFINEYEIEIIWLTLPPVDGPNNEEYGWNNFNKFNDIVHELLTPLGVLVLDSTLATEKRYKLDYLSTVDLLHWRSPGKQSVTYFINRVMLHTLAHRLAIRKKYHKLHRYHPSIHHK